MVGGLLLYWLNWRAIFAINIPLGLIAILIVWLMVKGSDESRDRQFKDITGSLLLIASLFYFIYTLNHLTDGLTNKLGHLIIPFILLSCFFIYERRIDSPLLNKEIFNHSGYIFANIIRMLCQFIFIGLLFIFPVTLQNIYTISSLKISLMLLPLTVLMGIGSIVVGKWISKVNPLLPVTLGCLIMLFACMWLSFMPPSLSISYLEVGLLMIGLAFALLFPGLNTIALTGHKPELSGQAFGVYYTNATLAGSMAVSISAEILKFFSQWHTKAFKTPELIPLASGLTPIHFKHYTIETLNLVYQIFHRGWAALFGFYTLLMVTALVVSLWKLGFYPFYRKDPDFTGAETRI